MSLNTHLKYGHLLLSCWLLLLTTETSAQYQSLRFDRITIEDGLPNPSVLDIMQDKQGFIWIGTLSGIVRYDGHEMKTYLPSATMQDSLPTRNIPNLYEDKSGNIWVGFQYSHVSPKLYRYDVGQDRFVPQLFDSASADNPIRRGISTMREDRLGRLLVGTWGDGLYAIDISGIKKGTQLASLTFQHFLHNPEDSSSLGNNVVAKGWGEDDEGNFWLPTDDGLCKFIPGKDQFKTFRFTRDTIPLANEFGVVLFEKPNMLWLGTVLHGLLKFNVEEEKFVEQYQHDPSDPFSISPESITKIIKAKDGKLWLGITGRMDIFDPRTGQFTHVKDDGQDVWEKNFMWNNALIEDYSGNIWAATWQAGIYKYNPGKGRFNLLRPDGKKLPGVKKLWAECEDSEGNIWFSTDKEGLVRWNRKNNSFRQYRHEPGNPNSLSNDWVESVRLSPDGTLWMGTIDGLDKMEAPGMFKHYHPFPKGKETKIFIAQNGNLYASTFNAEPGFCMLTNPATGTFKYFSNTLENLGGISSISTMEEDEAGNIWLGINQWGFYIHDPKTEKFEHFAEAFGIHDIHFDRFGNCWLATHSAGLKLWDRQQKKLIHLTKAEHDKIGIARSILEDRHGLLWMKTPNGIVQFDPRNRKVVQQFSRLNWMEKEELWYIGDNGFKTQTGEMFFNSPTGVLYFHPDSLQMDSFPPKVALTAFQLFNEKVEPGENGPLFHDISSTTNLTLAHWQNDFTFEFAALHFKSPLENTFQYKLENYDSDWHKAGTNRTANYTNLSPGHYTFRVKAANSDGVWGEDNILHITILRPWWKAWWAILLWTVLGLGVLLFIRNYELRRKLAKAEAIRLQELDTVKSKLYANITHEFRTPLTIIMGLAEQLKTQASESMKTSLNIIKTNGNQLLHLVNQILDLSKLESGFLQLKMKQGDIVSYLRYLTESFHSLAKQHKIKLDFIAENESITMDFDPERLLQVVSNLVSNALKFTPPGGAVTVTVEVKNLVALLKVKDTGIGISPEKLPKIFNRFYQVDASTTRQREGTGIGLALTQELVKLMGGTISVESEMGKGSKFIVKLPVKNEAPAFSNLDFKLENLSLPVPTVAPKKAQRIVKKAPANAPLVLIVEDNADVVAYLISCLDRKYRIAVANGGQQGIDRALELVPDLIISDVMMPEKDGFEVCRFLKKDERTSHIPIILLTAKADDDSKLTGLGIGADAYLSKPFNPEELLIRTGKLLELRKNLRAHYLRLSGLENGQPLDSQPAEPAEQLFLKKAREIIEENLDDNRYAVPDLCKALGMSRTQLHRKLTSLTGHSANHYIRLIRLEKAKLLLRNDSANIAEISYSTGFSTPEYFSRIFRKETGMTPSKFREKT